MKYLITESQMKNIIKKFFKKDFTEKIEMIQSWEALPSQFKRMIGKKEIFNRYLNYFGPMFIILVDGEEYLAQDREDSWVITDDEDTPIEEYRFMRMLGIEPLGITMNEFIDAYVDQ